MPRLSQLAVNRPSEVALNGARCAHEIAATFEVCAGLLENGETISPESIAEIERAVREFVDNARAMVQT